MSDFEWYFFSGFRVIGGCCWFMDGAGALVSLLRVYKGCLVCGWIVCLRPTGGSPPPPPRSLWVAVGDVCVCVRLLEVSVWPIE